MPAALDVDWEQVRAVAITVGVRESARRFGLPEDAVKQRSWREGWLRQLPRNQQLPPTVLKPVPVVTTAAEELAREMRDLNSRSRLSMARGLHKAAEVIETRDGQENLIDASNVKATVQSLNMVHGWQDAGGTRVTMNFAATGGQQATVMDVEAQATAIEDAPSEASTDIGLD